MLLECKQTFTDFFLTFSVINLSNVELLKFLTFFVFTEIINYLLRSDLQVLRQKNLNFTYFSRKLKKQKNKSFSKNS